MPRVLVIEDDRAECRATEIVLTGRGFDVVVAGSAREAFAATALPDTIDVVLLDLGLPDADGVSLCGRLRTWPGAPIIVVSGDGREERIIGALAAGADDFVVKPIVNEVLLARIQVQLRHAARASASEDRPIRVGDVELDAVAHRVRVGGVDLDLNAQLFIVLRELMFDAGCLVTYERLLRALGKGDQDGERQALRSGVSRLRKQLGTGAHRPDIVVERHVGYRLMPPSPTP